MFLTSISYDQDALKIIATRIVEEQLHRLPDLSDIFIIIPDFQPALRLTRLICSVAAQHGFQALLPPQCLTLREYIERHTYLETGTIPSEQRVLVLMESLQAYRHLFNDANLWTASDALFSLFDQLTLHQTSLPEDLDSFIQLLEQGYGCNASQIPHLGQEAQLVHTLWQAWHQQLATYNLLDGNAAYLIKLGLHLNQTLSENTFFYAFLHQEMLPGELNWMMRQYQSRRSHLFCYRGEMNEFLATQDIFLDDKPGTSECSAYLDSVFLDQSDDLRNRALNAQQQYPTSPVAEHIHVFRGDSFEDEARAISLQVRLWRLKNIKRVGLVIEDRQLARRIRAMLERANIALRDAGGWSLSTSSAAAILESWLECIEEDFAHRPLLSVIKSSSFIVDNETLDAVYRLEYDIIRRENITRNLDRYRNASHARAQRLSESSSHAYQTMFQLFDKLENAARPLQSLVSNNKIELSHALSALRFSLDELGLTSHLQNDDAGQELLQLLEQLQQVAQRSPLRLGWEDFRTWLSRNLERKSFKPVDDYIEYVDLLHLPQTSLGSYEGIIIGGLTREHFPGSGEVAPFFNQQVRQQLGLTPWQEIKKRRLHDFRRLLESAPSVLLSVNTGGESQAISPWLELLEAHHRIAWKTTLEHTELRELLDNSSSDIASPDLGMHTLCEISPPAILSALMPSDFSASAHQKLIDCPYAWFAGYVLRLQAPEEVSEVMAKNEYGSRVHLCLEALHANVKNLPGPFKDEFTPDNRQNAIELLDTISQQVFASDLEQNFQHRGWLRRWQKAIPTYIDWQIEREQHWRFRGAEQRRQQETEENFTISGRIDRFEVSKDGSGKISIIDYKTGFAHSRDDALKGESVQLAHYALAINEAVTETLFLKIDQDGLSEIKLADDELKECVTNNRRRLHEITNMARNGSALPAWGDEDTCGWCQFSGLCRQKDKSNGGPKAA
ncbi:MAG: PD-(D/E)XK nuclease family protein [Gammaproteobacteria bacterium]|nr:PD-(D/E)XK nuclease family protein [Gammaproteobacteria bacterium]